MLQLTPEAHHFGSREDLLEVQGLGRSYDIPDGVGIPVFDAILDGREIGRGVEETSVAFADDGRFAIKCGIGWKENAECALAGGCDAAFLEFGAERGEGVVVGAFPEALIESDVEQVVEFFEFAPGEFDRLFPDGEVLGIARLELHEFLAGGAFDVFIRLFKTGHLAVKAHQFGNRVFFQILAVQEMLPAVNDLSKLCAPVADVVVGRDIMPKKSCDSCEAVAENRAPDMTDMHGLGDIRRAEIEKDFFWTRRWTHSKAGIHGQTREGFGEKGILKADIDKTCAGNFRSGCQSAKVELCQNLAGELAWIRLFFLGEDHGGVGLVIPKAGVGGLGDIRAGRVVSTSNQRVAQACGEKFTQG